MKYKQEFLSDLSKLISFRSVLSEKEGDAPFGVESKNALLAFLDMAKSMGLETINYDNYGGEVFYGEGEEVGIIGHVDVVPEGTGWDTDPYVLTYKNGNYYARGVSDDKGFTLMCLYALKELKESGIKPNKKFRLIVGTNEEAGWKDVEYLKQVMRFPVNGFSPDGDFPVTYAEKGVTVVTFELDKMKNFYDIKGGTVVNAVCGLASCKAKKEGINEKLIYENKLNLNGDTITSVGKSCHGSTPQHGINALNALFNYFYQTGEDVKTFIDYVINDKSGLRNLENEQGSLTMSPDIVYEKDGKVFVACDMRIPAPFDYEKDVKKYLDSFGLKYSVVHKHPPFLADKNCEFCQKLLSAYKEVTGDYNAQPIYESGSTYARVFENGFAFGAGGVSWHKSGAHEANEKLEDEAIDKIYEIYLKTIFSLAK